MLEVNESPKLCVRCRYIELEYIGEKEFHQCGAPQNMINKSDDVDSSLVNGKPYRASSHKEKRWTFCSTQRRGGYIWAFLANKCGPQGRWWQPIINVTFSETPTQEP